MQERLTAWQRSMKRHDWERRRHHEVQAARVVDVEVQQRFLSSEYVTSLTECPPVGEFPPLPAEARRARDDLMTVLMVLCAGRPSHVTGITASAVPKARIVCTDGQLRRLIKNFKFKTSASATLEVAVSPQLWRRLLHHASVERPVLLTPDTASSDRLFIGMGGGPMSSSSAAKAFKATWRRALPDGDVPELTASGVRYGAVVGTAAAEPEAQG
ncbi:uncharacterized protein LOC119112414 [Pollicipes pollicipes]|uniref:uncharacterized protein LOC119112414 n=1 Tax=Pollicipes pollicipes TaxID=41117 RepID=UPI0018850FE6|nr:uncharacterized protein LOC119112414 [Pollicipes pollicipes]